MRFDDEPMPFMQPVRGAEGRLGAGLEQEVASTAASLFVEQMGE